MGEVRVSVTGWQWGLPSATLKDSPIALPGPNQAPRLDYRPHLGFGNFS